MSDEDVSSEPEFGTMAAWTVDAVGALGDDHALAAACRGSGGPAALGWFAEHLQLGAGVRLLDVGAGMGGPAAWARATAGAVPVLVEPMEAACRAATDLFALAPIVATAEHLPLGDATVGRAWSLGVLCTTSDQRAALGEVARVLEPGGACGLLVYVRTVADLDTEPEVNHFPVEDELRALVDVAGLAVTGEASLSDLPDPPASWRAQEEAVDDWIEQAHGHTDAWQDAHDDEAAVGHLLQTGQVVGRLLVVAREGARR
ncbi:class I SAM-dependent methyltransferase [Iamia sp. SCSIO 61187]|uniref:class I SAM-dependent methyltransferase n=1 Tax=Iamia sp. SCSIO 61187 TaxID=2722752 RepID=UPI001C629043|nr:methyltransferase domain-containing protein [Iamia sp. SCSIO 61187]